MPNTTKNVNSHVEGRISAMCDFVNMLAFEDEWQSQRAIDVLDKYAESVNVPITIIDRWKVEGLLREVSEDKKPSFEGFRTCVMPRFAVQDRLFKLGATTDTDAGFRLYETANDLMNNAEYDLNHANFINSVL